MAEYETPEIEEYGSVEQVTQQFGEGPYKGGRGVDDNEAIAEAGLGSDEITVV